MKKQKSKRSIADLRKTTDCKQLSKAQQGKLKGGAGTIIIEDTQAI